MIVMKNDNNEIMKMKMIIMKNDNEIIMKIMNEK